MNDTIKYFHWHWTADGRIKIDHHDRKEYKTNFLRRVHTELRQKWGWHITRVHAEKLPNGGAFVYWFDNYGAVWLDVWADFNVLVDFVSKRVNRSNSWLKGAEFTHSDDHRSDERWERVGIIAREIVLVEDGIDALNEAHQARDLNFPHWGHVPYTALRNWIENGNHGFPPIARWQGVYSNPKQDATAEDWAKLDVFTENPGQRFWAIAEYNEDGDFERYAAQPVKPEDTYNNEWNWPEIPGSVFQPKHGFATEAEAARHAQLIIEGDFNQYGDCNRCGFSWVSHEAGQECPNER